MITYDDIAVVAEEQAAFERARKTAGRLKLALRQERDDAFRAWLLVSQNRIAIQMNQKPRTHPIACDWSTRPRKKPGKKQLFARALGIEKGTVNVVDATAGLGRDTEFMLQLGCQVEAIEKSPVLFEMLHDAWTRVQKDWPERAAYVRVIQEEAGEYLKTLITKGRRPDTVYLDPMFPIKKKSALSSKEMQALKQLVGEQGDWSSLLEQARETAKMRVVVKRPLWAPPLLEGVTHRFEGRRVRYDMYVTEEGGV